MPPTPPSSPDLVHDRAGPSGDLPVVLLHAGIADRRMWDPQWPGLTAAHDTIRLDLRGFGDSVERPAGTLSHPDDVLEALAALGVERCHLVGASLGAGVAVEVALASPATVASLLLVAPGGSLIAEATPELLEFARAEGAALREDDRDAAVDANLSWWVDGPRREAAAVATAVRDRVREMQRRAFDLTWEWDDIEEDEPDPPTVERLAEVRVPTLVLVGGQDIDAIHRAVDLVTAEVAGARRIDWPDVAHLPSMERPDDFEALVLDWLRTVASEA